MICHAKAFLRVFQALHLPCGIVLIPQGLPVLCLIWCPQAEQRQAL
jgi:hypothetical protein